MSELINPFDYPKLESKQLEIIPLFSNKLLYQSVPTTLPNLNLQDKCKFLTCVLNIFEKDDNLKETGFRIDYLQNQDHQQAFKSIHRDFDWINQNTYSLLAICNFVPQIFDTSQCPTTRSSAQDTRDAFEAVINRDEYEDLRTIMDEANQHDTSHSLDKFINLVKKISKSLFILIVKMHQAIVLNYHAFRLEAATLSLHTDYNELLLGLCTKEMVVEKAKQIHEIRQEMNKSYVDYLALRNHELDPFIQAIIPGLVFSNVFSFENYKSQLLAGDFGKIWHHQSVPLPMSEPKLKELSEALDSIITKIAAYKATEVQVQEKGAKNLKKNIQNIINKWKLAKEENSFTIPFLEVILEGYKSLKREAIQIASKIEWTEDNIGISQDNLDQQVIEISQALSDAKDLKKKSDDKEKKISDNICSKCPNLSLPRIQNPSDILLWMKNYKQMSEYIPNDLTKISIIKSSLTNKDKKAVEHLDSVGAILSFIHSKYMKPDIILSILLKNSYALTEPWTLSQSLKNIDEFLLNVTNFFEFKMETNINSKFRDDLVPKLFTQDYRIRFIEMIQAFEATLTTAVSSSDPLAICMEDLTKKSEITEIEFFTNKLDSASDPQQEKKRLTFWLDSIRKLALQMRKMSLYIDEKAPPPTTNFLSNP